MSAPETVRPAAPASTAALVDLIRARIADRPLLVGIAGAVAVGKTTLVGALADALTRDGHAVEVVSTDAFLLANDELAARGLLMRKGFPDSYDAAAITTALGALRAGAPTRVGVYSHDTYDLVPGATEPVAAADVILIEGIVALQPPTVEHLDLAIYVDADEADVRCWFVARFARLTAAAADAPESFYHRFAALPAEQIEQIATATWETINAPNLREHIAPSAARADVVVRKAADHSIAALRRSSLVAGG